MADKKISQLTGATTPVAGTETLPIVQGGSTKQVSIANLTAGRAVSAAQLDVDNIRVDGNTVSSTNTNGDVNLTPNGTGRIVSLSTFIQGLFSSRAYAGAGAVGLWFDTSNNAIRAFNAGTPGLANGTIDLGLSDSRFKDIHLAGNVIVASGKGIDFSADGQAAGMTSELLDDYEEGTWTPSFLAYGPGSSLPTFADFAASGVYTKIGRQVFVTGLLSWTGRTGGAGFIAVDGLPFNISPHTIQADMEFDEAFASSLGVSEAIWKAGLKPRTFQNSGIARFKFGYASGAGTNVVTDLGCTDLLDATVRMRFSLVYIV